MNLICALAAGVGLIAGSTAFADDEVKTPPPPCSGPVFKALDFWSGEWTAILPKGAPLPSGDVAQEDIVAADARVEPILDGCVYLESWDSVPFANGQVSRGKGFHHYDATSGNWRQIWVTNSGRENISIGELYEGGVRYLSERTDAEGKTTLSRQTIIPVKGGEVRNYSERSSDDGATWALSYDFIYRRK